jgi:peptide/nickel transport system substrate-binding protein
MTALAFNTRRAVFADHRVRQALIQAFNFEWINRTLFHNLYKRTQSYFERSALASIGRSEPSPADERELDLLGAYKGSVRPEILDGTYRFPVTDGGGHNRENVRRAYDLLVAAGYALKDGVLTHAQTGQPLAFEILVSAPGFERTLSPFTSDLKRLGIDARIRAVDSAQYQSRLKDYDYDMIQTTWAASLSPGNEQLFRWSSAVADTPGSYNYAGVKSPAVDAMIAHMLSAETAEDFTAAVRALDRVLLSGDYVIPLYHAPSQWIAHWRRLRHPEVPPLFGYNLESWWIEEDRAASTP